MKKLNLKKPAIKRASRGRIGPPQFFESLYRDLRDRRLLLPLAALLVALVAVPMLIKQGGEETAPAPPPPEFTAAEATAVEPAVLAEQQGIRSYKERLKDLKEKDPFAPAFEPKELKEPKVAVAETGGSSAAGESSSPSSAPSSSSSSSSTSIDVDPTPVNDSTLDDSPAVDVDGQPVREIRFFSSEVDVAVGESGNLEQVDNVRYLDYLPGKATPLLTFLGFGDDTDQAVFLVSPNVTDRSGDAECAPKKPAPCQFLTMQVGDAEKLVYGNQSKAFTIKLLATRVVEVDDPRKG